MLDQDIIITSNSSPYNRPLWIVPKKIDNSDKQKWRIVIELSYNKWQIEGILDKLGRAQYFTLFDLAKAFNQIPVSAKGRKNTAFLTPFGHFGFWVEKCPSDLPTFYK